MGKIKPYLSVKNALEAFELYANIFNAEKIEHMPVGKEQATEFGLGEDADLGKTTMHMSFKIGEEVVYMSDNFSGAISEKNNVSLLYEPDSLDQMKSIYAKAEASQCKITMKLEKQFWGDYFTSFTDPYGVAWQMNFSPPKE